MTTEEAIQELQEIKEKKDGSLVSRVADILAQDLEDYEEPETLFDEIQEHGCISGMISELIYYKDTQAFYDEYYDDIEDLRYNFETDTGESLKPDGDLKNWYAWFAFEETAYRLRGILGI